MAATERARRLGRRFILVDNFLVVVGFNLVFPLIGLHFVDQLGWLAALVGLALGVRQMSQQGLGLLGGSLADRFGAKPMIVAGMLLRAVGFALLAVAHSPWVLMLSCMLSGLGGTLFEPSRSALIVKLTRLKERSRFYSVLMMFDSVAAVSGALLGTFLLKYDFFWVAIGGSVVFVVVAMLNAWLLPAWRVTSQRTSAKAALGRVLADKRYILLVLTFSGYFMLLVQIMLLLPIVIKQMAHSAQAVGWMYALDAALSLLLVYPLARLGERYLSLQARVLVGIAVMTASLAAMALVHEIGMAFVMLSLFFIGSLIAEPARESLMASYAQPEARGSYMGLGRLGLAIGGLVGYTCGGLLHDHARELGMPSLPWMVLALIGCVTMLGLYRQFFVAKPMAGVAGVVASGRA
jgi:DHA1 family multidrug resistance protein-like MFS transporter